MTSKISHGTVHTLPKDFQSVLVSDDAVLSLWEDITPLARNEFICWVEDAKQQKTRERRIRRSCEELLDGNRRPCCWSGCIHRKDKELSPTQKWIRDRKKVRHLTSIKTIKEYNRLYEECCDYSFSSRCWCNGVFSYHAK